MDIGEFKNERVGKLVSVQGTIFHTFEPNKFPFKINYNSEIVLLLSKASRSLGHLSEAGKKLRNH